MGTTVTYPNGQTLTTSALTQQAINILMQTLTCGLLGINPPDPSRVRVTWQTQGQPFQNANQDICYLSITPQDAEYSRVRDRSYSDDGPVTSTDVYTKAWRVSWHMYGPAAQTNAQLIWSAMFTDYANDQLTAQNLYPVSSFQEPVRLPEEINGQWFEHSTFEIELYEQVTETIQTGAATSVEIKVEDSDGQLADITVTKP